MSNSVKVPVSGASASSKNALDSDSRTRCHPHSSINVQLQQSLSKLSLEETSHRVNDAIHKENIEFVQDLIKKRVVGKKVATQRKILKDFFTLTGNHLEEVAERLGYNSVESFFIMNSLKVISTVEDLKNMKTSPQSADYEEPESHNGNLEKSIFVKLSDGTSVQVQVDSQTCWVSIDYLVKIFQFAGTFMKAFCEERKVISKHGFIPYEGLCLMRTEFYQSFTSETEIILDQLDELLKKTFKAYNGFDFPSSAIPSID